jgi:DNA-binding GntR family transcriptional regulator
MESDKNLEALRAPSKRTLSDHVADQLRQAILTNQFEPGQRLVEQDIAESMEMSRGPVRDALKQLETEGLVVRQSYRSTFVAKPTLEDVEEIYTLREALESLAIRYAIKNASDEQLDELEEIVQSMATLVEQSDFTQLEATELDMTFHRKLCEMSGHQRLLSAWLSLSAQIRLVVLTHRIRNPRDMKERAIEWHLHIVNAMRSRDVDKALDELKRHLAVSTEWVMETIQNDRSGETDQTSAKVEDTP